MNNGEARVAHNLTYRDHRIGIPGSPLAPQERRIMDLIAEGLTNREIGQRMGLAEGTVKVYMSRAMSRLSLRNVEGSRYQIIVRHWKARVAELERRLIGEEAPSPS